MEKQKITKLIFIYNANSGKRNAILDSFHKIVSPNTYDCKLCEITYGVFTENSTWKKFRENTNFSMKFLHKDEFLKEYASKFGNKFTFPIVLSEDNQGLSVGLTTEKLNAVENVDDLIYEIKQLAE